MEWFFIRKAKAQLKVKLDILATESALLIFHFLTQYFKP